MSYSELVIPFVSPGEVLAAGIVIPILGTVAVALRFWLRQSHQIGLRADDWLVLAALVFMTGLGICLIYGVSQGSLAYATPEGADSSPEIELTSLSSQQRLVELLDWIVWILMIPANGCIKLSALFFYRRIFVVNKRSVFGIVSLIAIIICVLWTVAFFFATIFGCGTNFDYPWKPLLFIAMCNTNVRLDGLMISDLITDILVWLLPIPVIWGLNMSSSRKLSVSCVLLLAAVSLAAAIVRLIVQLQISYGGYSAHTDVDLTLTTLLYWSMIESGLAVIATCLPTLHQLFARSTLRSAVASLRRMLSSDSSAQRLVDVRYYEVESGQDSARPSHRARYEKYEAGGNAYGMIDMKKAKIPVAPEAVHVKHGGHLQNEL